MRIGVRTVCALAIAALTAGLPGGIHAESLVVNTAQGKVRGKTINQGKVKAFLGLPYAAPPIGDLRWSRPSPARWKGERDVTEFGAKDSLREEYVKNHMDGTKTIGSYQFNENGDQVKWIVFKPENQEDFNKLFNHLNNCNVVGIPFKTENNYDILVMFSKYISAKIARKFAQDRLKEIDITCSILPKENKVKKDKNRHGEFMKLPFNGIDSKIMIKGKWRNDFNNLKIGFVDVDSIDKSVERDIV